MQDEATINRLKRIEGQIGGIRRMVESDRYCIDILTQIAAARAALMKVEEAVLDNHAAHCIEEAIRSGDPEEQRRKFRELIGLMGRSAAR